MERTLQLLNELAPARLVTGYAIGGAMAAFFCAEADVDVCALMDILQRHGLLEKWNQFKRTEG